MNAFQAIFDPAIMMNFTSKSASIIDLGQNTIETHRILKEYMEELYQNYVHKHDYFIDKESIFRAHIAWLSMSSWNDDSQHEINLGELFGILMSLYNFWVRPDIKMNDEALSDYIGELFFSARELVKSNPNEKIVRITGELVCGQDESVLKIFYWGSWILETSVLSKFSCRLNEKGVKVHFDCPVCGNNYIRDSIEIGQKMTCIECKKEMIVPVIKQRGNTPLTAPEATVLCKRCGEKMKKMGTKKKNRLLISGIFSFLTGLTSVLLFKPSIIPSIFLVLLGISLAFISAKLWHCPNCGTYFRR